jgi:hypothetical protein
MSIASSCPCAARALIAALGLTGTAAQAQMLAMNCSVWDTRSRILAHATDLPDGLYRVSVTSTHKEGVRSPLVEAVDGVADFHFDSKKRAIDGGATKISRDFIVRDQATAYLIDESGLVRKITYRKCHDRTSAAIDDGPGE